MTSDTHTSYRRTGKKCCWVVYATWVEGFLIKKDKFSDIIAVCVKYMES